MITKMKKLTFLVYHKEYEAFLAQIRELGVVHVVERQCGEMDDTLQRFMQKRTLYKKYASEHVHPWRTNSRKKRCIKSCLPMLW